MPLAILVLKALLVVWLVAAVFEYGEQLAVWVLRCVVFLPPAGLL